MKIHPTPNKLNTTFVHNIISPLSQNKLRRLPHIFDKVLELPFQANTHVSVEETYDFLKFTVSGTDGVVSDVVTDTVKIHPGMMKVVVRSRFVVDVLTEFELDLWRVRLPEMTRPELAYAFNDGGDLVVVVPKGEESWSDDSSGNVVVWGGCIGNVCNNNFVLVN